MNEWSKAWGGIDSIHSYRSFRVNAKSKLRDSVLIRTSKKLWNKLEKEFECNEDLDVWRNVCMYWYVQIEWELMIWSTWRWLKVEMCKAEGKVFKGMEWVKSDGVWREEEGLHMMTLNGDWFKMQITYCSNQVSERCSRVKQTILFWSPDEEGLGSACALDLTNKEAWTVKDCSLLLITDLEAMDDLI